MWISRYFVLFILYSFLGWVYETIFCTIKGGKWENRGFLYGPICPIYGTGAIAISAMMELSTRNGIYLDVWQIFLATVVGSAVLEYVTSWVLEKLFHAIWWDYSNLPLNLHGRISLFTSLGFGLGGLLLVYVIAPFTENLIGQVSPIMVELQALLLLFITTVDLSLTVTALLHFDKIIAHMDDSFNRSMEAVVDNTVQQSNKIKENIIRTGRSVNEQLNSLNGFVKSTVRRVYSFRDRDEQRKTVKNSLLSRIRKKTK